MAGGWCIDAYSAMDVHSKTQIEFDNLKNQRHKVRDSVRHAQASVWEHNIQAALQSFWNNEVAVQAQAAETKVGNALTALDSMVQNYLAADYESARIASEAGDAIPDDVGIVNDTIGVR